MSKPYSEILWTEKYRPKKIEQLILPKRLRDRFENGIDSNLLLAGTAGLGKTTLAKILAQGRSTLFINASLERGVDAIRNKVSDFAGTSSLTAFGKKKVIILDESDNLTKDAQKGLKATIEAYHKNALFIFTANNPQNLIAPIISRLEYINFNFSDEEKKEQLEQYIVRCRMILNNEGRFKITNKALSAVLKSKYPDMRAIINSLNQICRSKEPGSTIEIEDVDVISTSKNVELYEFLISEYRPDKIYAKIRGMSAGKERQILYSLGSEFLQYLNSKKHYNQILPCAQISQKYQYELSNGDIDPLVTLLACCHAISTTFKNMS